MKNDTTFVRMRSGDHLGDAKMSKKAPRSVEFNFLLIAIDRNGFRRIKEEGQIYKTLPQILYFLPRDLVMIFHFGDDFTPFFQLWKTITKSLGKKLKNLRQTFVAMSMVNKCAKFLKDSNSVQMW